MTSQAEYKVICFHECVTGYGAPNGGAMRPQPGNTRIVNVLHVKEKLKYDMDVFVMNCLIIGYGNGAVPNGYGAKPNGKWSYLVAVL